MQITDKDIQTFRERAKTELQSNGAVGRLAWDSVVAALCNEVEELRKNAAPGNAAALREAAERICYLSPIEAQDLRQLAQFCHDQSIYGGGLIERVLDDIEIVRQALSTPPEPPSNAAAMREALVAVKDNVYTGAYGNCFAVANINLCGYSFAINIDQSSFRPHIKVMDQKEVLNRVVDELVDCVNKDAASRAALAAPPKKGGAE